jgi:uncharacterized Zn-binding protein involved in type VI secretion
VRRRVLEAAGVGHRITHDDDLPEPREIVLIALSLLQKPGEGGAAAARLGRTLARDDSDPDACGELERGSRNTFIGRERRAAALADDDVDVACDRDSDGPVVEGARHVWVNRKRWARRSDELDCGARVGEGEPTILLGEDKERSADRSPPWVMLLEALLAGGDLDASWAARYGGRVNRRRTG